MLEEEERQWEEARLAPPPPQIEGKDFCPKFQLPRLPDYTLKVFPEEYWQHWPKNRLEEAEVKSWANQEEIRKKCQLVGIDTESGQAKAVLNDLQFGANIGAEGRSRQASCGPNNELALEHGEKVQDSICSFVEKGVFVGPLTMEEAGRLGELKIHPITARLKPDGSVRVIVDASYPYGGLQDLDSEEAASLNQFIDISQYPVKMDGIPQFLVQLEEEGRGAQMAKEDMSDAYKHVPVRLEDWRLQAINWGGKVFIDTKLMFGTSSSAGIFDRFDGLLLAIAVKLSKTSPRRAKRFLDDVFAVDSKKGLQIHGLMETYRQVCKEVGAKLDPKKSVQPTTEATILGVKFNSTKWTWSVAGEKARKIWDKVEMAMSKHLPKKGRQSVVGSLWTIACLMPESRIWAANLFAYSESGGVMTAQQGEFWKMAIKKAFLGHRIPSTPLRIPGNCIKVYTDAAGPQAEFLGRGVGVVIQGSWGFLPFPAWMGKSPEKTSPTFENGRPVDFRHKLSFLEALGPLWALTDLANKGTGRTIVAYVDNLGTVLCSQKGYSAACGFLNAAIQAMQVVAKGLGTRLVLQHIYRLSNTQSTVADMLSKGQIARARQTMELGTLMVPLESLIRGVKRPRRDGVSWGVEMLRELEDKGIRVVKPSFVL